MKKFIYNKLCYPVLNVGGGRSLKKYTRHYRIALLISSLVGMKPDKEAYTIKDFKKLIKTLITGKI